MSIVKSLGAQLSENPSTSVVSHAQGLNGQVNATATGKLFYVAKMLVLSLPKPEVKSSLIWADDNGRFSLSVAEYNTYMKDVQDEGTIVRFDNLAPYSIDGKTFTHAKLLVMKSEDQQAVLNSFIKRQTAARVAAGVGEELGD